MVQLQEYPNPALRMNSLTRCPLLMERLAALAMCPDPEAPHQSRMSTWSVATASQCICCDVLRTFLSFHILISLDMGSSRRVYLFLICFAVPEPKTMKSIAGSQSVIGGSPPDAHGQVNQAPGLSYSWHGDQRFCRLICLMRIF